MKTKYLIVGGGFFGSYLAYLLKNKYKNADIIILEREKELLRRASYNNQARAHHGYHYPRSFLTAFSSNKNFDRFVEEFKECIVDNFEKYYAVGRIQSKVTASQFKEFCDRIKSPLEPAPSHVKALVNPKLVEDIFLAKEHAFDADILKDMMKKKLAEKKIPVLYMHEAVRLVDFEIEDETTQDAGFDKKNKKGSNNKNNDKKSSKLKTEVLDLKTKKTFVIESDYVFNCTYSNINTFLKASNIEPIDLKQEMTEMPLIKIPKEMEGKSITIMCGPFFSIMPFPPKGVYSIHHVRYTPHYYWHDKDSEINNQKHFENAPKNAKTNFKKIIKDVSRYVPCMEKAEYLGSIWEIKTILPRNENDDGRPILYKKDVSGVKNLICIMGGKLDNIYDLEDRLEELK